MTGIEEEDGGFGVCEETHKGASSQAAHSLFPSFFLEIFFSSDCSRPSADSVRSLFLSRYEEKKRQEREEMCGHGCRKKQRRSLRRHDVGGPRKSQDSGQERRLRTKVSNSDRPLWIMGLVSCCKLPL